MKCLSKQNYGGWLQLMCLWLLQGLPTYATQTISEWTPLYKGIEHATMRQVPGDGDSAYLYISVLKVDLLDPDIQLLSTPPITNYVQGSRETGANSVSGFLQDNRVQVAINANFYNPNEVTAIGTPMNVLGLHISQGRVVGPAQQFDYRSSFYFTTNKEAFFYPTNWPAKSTNGIYTAVTGLYPLLYEGIVVANNATSPVNGREPRTAIGTSKNKRYLYMMTVDGRQGPIQGMQWSEGTEDEETAYWIQYFGAYNAVNMDGGGSTTMSMADCLGNAVRLNSPSYLFTPRARERYVGSHLGVFAKPLTNALAPVTVEIEGGTAIVRWTSPEPATTQVFYGSTTNYGFSSSLDSSLTLQHEVLLEGLAPGSSQYLKIVSTTAQKTYTAESCFTVTMKLEPVFDFSQVWRFQTNSLNGIPWTEKAYNDTGWVGKGPGVLYFDSNVNIPSKGTLLPSFNASRVAITFYFRTHFTNLLSTQPYSLTFSNYIDDGAVFYLNGKEIQRVRMAQLPTTITSTTTATGFSCNTLTTSDPDYGDAAASCPTVFTVSGSAMTNLVQGDNVLAVEVHNYNAGSPDVVFGTSLFVTPLPAPKPPQLTLTLKAGDHVEVRWSGGQGYILEQASTLSASPIPWASVSGNNNASVSPVSVPIGAGAKYFRLRSP